MSNANATSGNDPKTALRNKRLQEFFPDITERDTQGWEKASIEDLLELFPNGPFQFDEEVTIDAVDVEAFGPGKVLRWVKNPVPTDPQAHDQPPEMEAVATPCATDPQAHKQPQKTQEAAPIPLASPPDKSNSQVVAPTIRAGQPKQATKGKRIDERMLVTIRDNQEAMYWPSTQWCEHLNCSASTVRESKTWKNICRTARERERLARGKRLRRRSR